MNEFNSMKNKIPSKRQSVNMQISSSASNVSPTSRQSSSKSPSPGSMEKSALKRDNQNLVFKVDQCYGFDFAIYEGKEGDPHKHSIALGKMLEQSMTMRKMEKLVKIASAVKKEVWVLDKQDKNKVLCKLKLSRIM